MDRPLWGNLTRLFNNYSGTVARRANESLFDFPFEKQDCDLEGRSGTTLELPKLLGLLGTTADKRDRDLKSAPRASCSNGAGGPKRTRFEICSQSKLL